MAPTNGKTDETKKAVDSRRTKKMPTEAYSTGSSWSSPNDTNKNGEQTTTNGHSTKPSSTAWRLAEFFGSLLRFLLLDVTTTVIFGLYVITHFLQYLGDTYMIPQIQLMKWTPDRNERELTYYHRNCGPQDQTAHDVTELLITPDMTAQDSVNHMIQHGASVYPNILSPETAAALRQHILESNHVGKDMIDVIENKKRWSQYLQVDQHPSIAAALREIYTQPAVVDALEGIIGPNPAVIEMTCITSAYGAATQFMHQDVIPEGNGAKWARTFVPSYSLFVPLQNTTAAMGATELCPGSHMCSGGASQFCDKSALKASGRHDNWPVGWGALVNQQTSHRGPAHVDKGGPDRVLFILTFAPRPRVGPAQTETRTIGQGGSYSLHWSQWGHTLADFQNPAVRMKKPFRILQSFGLYKLPSHKQWGWDYLTQVSGRIANEDVGFDRYYFDGFYEKGGFTFLPKWLQSDVPKAYDSTVWIEYTKETVNICQEALQNAHLSAVAAYLGFVVVALIFHRRGQSRASTLFFGLCRLFWIHGVVLLVAWICLRRLDNSTWAKNIRGHRSFHHPEKSIALAPELPASLPMREDTLIFDHMQSDYLGSYTRVLEVFHPGNREWNEMVTTNSAGYEDWTPALQEKLRSSMLQWTAQRQSRIMTKNDQGNWAEVGQGYADWFCHKELMKRSNRFVKEAVKQLDYLLSETRFGYWRATSMHRNAIPKYLMALQDRILGLSRESNKKSLGEKQTGVPAAMINSSLTSLPTRAPPIVRRSGVPPEPVIVEPFENAWLKEGDLVEASFKGRRVEWYRAYITTASANRMSWDVVYADGDKDSDLCFDCIRRFVPYEMDEEIQWRDSDDMIFKPGRVTAIHSDETYDILLESGVTIENAPLLDLRRFEGNDSYYDDYDDDEDEFDDDDGDEELEEGDEVEVPFNDVLYRGKIVRDNGDGTFAIQFDDGDYEERVPGETIELA